MIGPDGKQYLPVKELVLGDLVMLSGTLPNSIVKIESLEHGRVIVTVDPNPHSIERVCVWLWNYSHLEVVKRKRYAGRRTKVQTDDSVVTD